MEIGSRLVAASAIKMAMSFSRQEEAQLKAFLMDNHNIKAVAVDYGGEFISSIGKLIERSIVASKREHLIKPVHSEEGAIAGATREAITQIMPKALGLNVGGKIGIARFNDHISVAIFVGIGLLHLDEVAIGLGHRAVS